MENAVSDMQADPSVQSRRLRLTWIGAAGACAILVVLTGQRAVEDQRRTASMRHELAQVAATAALPPSQPSLQASASARAGHKVLSAQLQALLRTAEGVEVEGARLVQVTMDAATGHYRLVFDLNKLERAPAVTAALASTGGSWQLEATAIRREGGQRDQGVTGTWVLRVN